MKILVTGFDPFGGATVNPAYEAVKMLPDEIKGIETIRAKIVKAEIPTVFDRGGEVLKEKIEEHHPDAVICVGQAGGRADISVERVAINLMEARIPDNDGNQPVDQKIYEDGENAYFATLPVKAMVTAIRDARVPATLSYTAGTYVCNDVMYRLLYMIDKEYPQMRGGFIHVPYLPEQALELSPNTPTMSALTIAKALDAAVRAVVNCTEDINAQMGTTH